MRSIAVIRSLFPALRRVRIIRAKAFNQHERLYGAGVGDHHAFFRGGFGDKVFVGALLAEAEHAWGFAVVGAELAVALNENDAVRGGFVKCNAFAGIH